MYFFEQSKPFVPTYSKLCSTWVFFLYTKQHFLEMFFLVTQDNNIIYFMFACFWDIFAMCDRTVKIFLKLLYRRMTNVIFKMNLEVNIWSNYKWIINVFIAKTETMRYAEFQITIYDLTMYTIWWRAINLSVIDSGTLSALKT